MSRTDAYRRDVDALRGIAILSVLGFHFAPDTIKGGFAGVDIFFVISGFLITGILIDGIGFKDFYIRRAKRLLPALCIALALALLLGFVLLLPDEFNVLARNVIAAATFTTNFVLIADHSAAGYFTNLAENNQLTHLWSLSVEEQYYLLWPLAFKLILPRWRLVAATGIFLLFVVFDFYNVFQLTTDRYYFPGTRFWEILAGTWLAIAQRAVKIDVEVIAAPVKLCGIALIVYAIFYLHPDKTWPGPQALVPVVGTTIYIAFRAQNSFVERAISNPALIWLGLISYPLYIYHWIFISFAQLTYRGELPIDVSILLAAISIAMADLTYRFIEIPVRRGKYGMARFALIPALLSAVIVVGLCVHLSGGLYWRHADLVAFNDMSTAAEKVQIYPDCLKRYGDVVHVPTTDSRHFCENGSDDPRPVMIVGDSHAQKLFYGFMSMHVRNIVHLGKGSCAPLWNLNPVHDPYYACQPEVNRLIAYAVNAEAPLAIFTGVFDRYFDGTYGLGKSDAEVAQDIAEGFQIMAQSRHPIIVVMDNPSLPFEPKECMERPVDINRRLDCSFDRAIYDRKASLYKDIFRRKARIAPNVTLIDASEFFCDRMRCHAANKDGLLYTGDNNHLSIRGAKIVDVEIVRMFPSTFVFDSRTNDRGTPAGR